ncbi:HMG box [Teladorsagia circumcincta]|uniref:HMG box n=1 Tax=Teladorsagia circumcincta TaxID=45464 RepID=A0A2G9U5S3_TELCI|nr:HMG box [Teladorsagia circumcincta]
MGLLETNLGFKITCSRVSQGEKQHKYPVTGMTMGPCAIFVKEHFAKHHPKDLVEGKNTMKEAGAAWKSLDEASRKKYEELSKRYREEKIKEFEALSEEEKKEVIAASLEAKEEKTKRKTQKPPTAYNLYVQEKYNSLKAQGEVITPVAKTMKRVSSEWKGMSEAAREKAAKLLDEYKQKLEEWKSKIEPHTTEEQKQSSEQDK